MRVLVAPDKFAGTLSAPQAAEAIAQGWLTGRPGDELRLLPLADGGPGFVEVLHVTLGGELHTVEVRGPLGEPVLARYLVVGDTAYVESAAACGLALLPEPSRDPWRATTWGVGELIAAAAEAGAHTIVVGLGGSATNDGGAGAVAALEQTSLTGIDLIIATDVDTPLLGPRGATYGFARQKGADPADLPALEDRMHQWSGRAPDLAGTPGAGAAGGLGFGLMLLGARRVPGIRMVLDVLDFDRQAEWADLVVTGEGKYDWQSLHGKVVSGVVEAVGAADVIVLAGQAETVDGGPLVFAVVDELGSVQAAMADPAGGLRLLAERVAREA